MEIKKIKLDDLKIVDKYLLSFPIRPGFYGELREKFVGLPFIIVNKEDEIIFGIDYYHYLRAENVVEVDVVWLDIPDKDALILNYNLKEKLAGLNLYEKLVFIKRITPLVGAAEIYRKTGLDIAINRELLGKLEMLLSEELRGILPEGVVTLRSALRLCDFQRGDREVLVDLFSRVLFSASHQQRILEMVEEVIFRDKCFLGEIFEKLEISKYMEMEKPQRVIMEVLFTYRYPVYVEAERQWREEVEGLGLPDNIKVTHYPFFEKRGLEVLIQVPGIAGLRELIKKLK